MPRENYSTYTRRRRRTERIQALLLIAVMLGVVVGTALFLEWLNGILIGF